MNRLLFALSFLLVSVTANAADNPDKFGIYISTLAGKSMQPVAKSSWQQLSHPHVSPDGKWITFTRYNEKHWGYAKEEDGYENTEIMLIRVDGSEMKTVIRPKQGILNCNSAWMDEGRSLVWLSTDNEEKLPWLMKLELETGKIARIPTPKDFKTTDPHVLDGRIVFPVIDSVDSLWAMNLDGSALKQLTHPLHPGGFRWFALPPGDYDPKFSPDGTQVAFMRLQKKNDWKIYTVDVSSGLESNLSGENSFDIVPDWSSDGKLIIFSHIDTDDLTRLGLYTMKPDGTGRRKIPLPEGYLPNQPQFFPNSGSGLDAKIVFQVMRFK